MDQRISFFGPANKSGPDLTAALIRLIHSLTRGVGAWKFLDSPEKDRPQIVSRHFAVGVMRAVFKPAASNVTSPHDELIVVFPPEI